MTDGDLLPGLREAMALAAARRLQWDRAIAQERSGGEADKHATAAMGHFATEAQIIAIALVTDRMS